MNTDGIPPDLEGLLDGLAQEEAQGLRAVWALAAEPTLELDADRVARVRHRLQNHRLEAEKAVARPPFKPLYVLHRCRRHLAAGVAAVLMLGAIGWVVWMRPVTYTAPMGAQWTVNLPDGSSVRLNSGSSVQHARSFDESRRVTLNGEGFFDVVHGSRPFVVETFNARVTVHGTRFNVRAWPGDMISETVVVLESGQVALAAAHAPADTVMLAPGQLSRVVADTTRPTPPVSTSTRTALAWRDGSLYFRDQWLGLILNDLERRYGITFANQPPSLNMKKLSFNHHDPPQPEVVVDEICRLLGLKYRKTATGFELYDPNVP